ncbi:hypothetical protein AYX13_07035 [Cryptococcus neoformans]|nr:hypothetical protein AYX13_07035 [Cryptococcus neoformans var. grubii]
MRWDGVRPVVVWSTQYDDREFNRSMRQHGLTITFMLATIPASYIDSPTRQ